MDFLKAFQLALDFPPCNVYVDIEKFSGHCQVCTFSDWLREFKSKIYNFDLSDAEKAKLLVANLTGPARDEIRYCLPEEKQNNFREVVKALRLCFSQENVHHLREVFYNRVQGDDEDLAEFSRDLIRLYAKVVDAADDEAEATALEQLRDEALANQFINGTRDARERVLLRQLYLENRRRKFEVLRREALFVFYGDRLRCGCDGLTTEESEFEAQVEVVFHESVVEQDDHIPDSKAVEDTEVVPTRCVENLSEASQGIACVPSVTVDEVQHDKGDDTDVISEGDLEALFCPVVESSEESTPLSTEVSQSCHDDVLEYVHKQSPDVGSRSVHTKLMSLDDLGIDIDSCVPCEPDFTVTECLSLLVWDDVSHDQDNAWGPWESSWKPNSSFYIPPAG